MFSRYVVSQVKHNSYFLVGLAIGLWLALATVPLEEEVVACEAAGTVATADEFEPQREERPLGPAGQPGRSVQRPRYYSSELGIRGGLLAGLYYIISFICNLYKLLGCIQQLFTIQSLSPCKRRLGD